MVDSKKPRYPLPKVIITASTVRNGVTLQASAGRYLEVVGEQPPLYIPRIEAAPVINGELNDSAWQREPDVPMLGRMDMGRKIEPSTSVWAAYDEEKLYVAFRCIEPDTGSLVLNAVERDDNLWEDDSVEILFDPHGESKTYYHIIVNAAGVIYDGRGFDKSFDIEGLKVAANIYDDNWTAEIAIPWRSLGIEVMPVGSTMLFARSRHVTGSDEIFQFPLSPGGNHQPGYFAKLTFGGPGGAHTMPANDR